MVFTEGTIIMHASGQNRPRYERVAQVEQKDAAVKNYTTYIPVGNAVQKISKWHSEGAKIVYLTSRKDRDEVDVIEGVMKKYNFPKGHLEFRRNDEEYKDVAERILPDILIEDDCESIGGEKEMTYTFVQDDAKKQIKSIPIPEFGGIDHLPDSLENLKAY